MRWGVLLLMGVGISAFAVGGLNWELADGISTWPVYQIPRLRAQSDNVLSRENLQNLMYRGGLGDEWKGDLDLLQARIMRSTTMKEAPAE